MNERIKKLAEQCWDRRLDGLHFDQEQFAKLIVKECAEISEQSQWSEAKGEYYEGFNEAMIYVSNKIKEHFEIS
jgi:hypothetical protein